MNNIMFAIILLITSCGRVSHKVSGEVDVKGSIEPNFKQAAEFCDDRYGEKTPEAEACFMDFRDYYTLKVSIDLDAIKNFCLDSYDIELDQEVCIADLVDLISEIGELDN